MNLPFTTDEFLGVFARYNEAVWPAQYLLNAVALVGVALILGRRRRAGHPPLRAAGRATCRAPRDISHFRSARPDGDQGLAKLCLFPD